MAVTVTLYRSSSHQVLVHCGTAARVLSVDLYNDLPALRDSSVSIVPVGENRQRSGIGEVAVRRTSCIPKRLGNKGSETAPTSQLTHAGDEPPRDTWSGDVG